jgi:hypothetical protein
MVLYDCCLWDAERGGGRTHDCVCIIGGGCWAFPCPLGGLVSFSLMSPGGPKHSPPMPIAALPSPAFSRFYLLDMWGVGDGPAASSWAVVSLWVSPGHVMKILPRAQLSKHAHTHTHTRTLSPESCVCVVALLLSPILLAPFPAPVPMRMSIILHPTETTSDPRPPRAAAPATPTPARGQGQAGPQQQVAMGQTLAAVVPGLVVVVVGVQGRPSRGPCCPTEETPY